MFVHSSFNIDFVTSNKKCYGDNGFAKVVCFPIDNYSYSWSTFPPQSNDTVFGLVNRDYQVEVLNNTTGCVVEDTVRIPGYDILEASFFSNQSGCLSLINRAAFVISKSIL